MRFTITPLGSARGRTVGQVVDDIVRYLDPDKPHGVARPTEPRPEAAQRPDGYYVDSTEEPGRWIGKGAEESNLRGRVRTEDFSRVLAGRDPSTGARLVTARGSAGRRPTLGVGSATRASADGELLYDTHDAAAALGVDGTELDALLAAGHRRAIELLAYRVSGTEPPARPAGSFLLPIIDAESSIWIRDSELTRVEAARVHGPTAAEILATGTADDTLPIGDAARLTGVTTRYLRGLARTYESERDVIESALADGRPVRRAYLPAHRGTKGRWMVRRADLAEFVARRTIPAVRVGFDLTLTTEKSLAVLALLGPSEVRDAALAAITAGNDHALVWWEQRAAFAQGSSAGQPTKGWTVASFRHSTSRALDPFPHLHNVVANTVELADRERRALDGRLLYRHAVGASAIATVEMRYRLTRELGVRWRRSASGGWEIDGIPESVLREFSQRRSEIDDALAELEQAIRRTSTIDELKRIVAKTRPPKQHARVDELVAGWWKRASAHGFSPDTLTRCVGREVSRATQSVDPTVLFRHLDAPDGVTAHGSVFTRNDLLATLADMPTGPADAAQPLLVPAERLEQFADRFLQSSHVVRLRPAEDHPRLRALRDEPIFTTRTMLLTQHRIISTFRTGLQRGLAAVPDDAVAEAVTTATLSGEQADLVRAFCGSGNQVHCAIGRAGSGKTTAMRAAANAWRTAGYRVLGAAVKGDAARHLATAAGIPTETLAWYLAHDDPANHPLDARTVLIVDEASTISDRDLDKLLHLATATGAAMRLIGDPSQHSAVAAGGMFRVLCERHPADTPQLSESRRLQHPADITAVEALRSGDIEQALASLQAAGHLHLAANDTELYAALLTRWWDSRQQGAPHPLIERSNHRRQQLNSLARTLLQANGEVSTDEITASRNRAFARGDEVIARKGDRNLHPPDRPDAYVRNGSRGTVIQVAHGDSPMSDEITVDFVDLGQITLPRAYFDEHATTSGRTDVGLDHAYALTSYAVQGATFIESTPRIDEHSSRAESYVDLTRGIQANHLYATRADDRLHGERLPQAPPPPLDVALAIRLRASATEVTAWELDPTAIERIARQPPARSVGR
jgi:conjugative relaxase-like TrwC/TraI family protein